MWAEPLKDDVNSGYYGDLDRMHIEDGAYSAREIRGVGTPDLGGSGA